MPGRRALAPLALALSLAPTRALADDRHGDGIYGRLEGDTVLSAEALGGVVSTGQRASPSVSAALRARFLDVVGLSLGYDRALDGPRYDAVWLAADFRPLFGARVNFNLQAGPRWLDLMIDSIGIELGAAWVRPGGDFGAGSGLGLVLGAGVELPLWWSRGRGVLLRVSGRWLAAASWDAHGVGQDDDGYELLGGLVVRAPAFTGLIGAH